MPGGDGPAVAPAGLGSFYDGPLAAWTQVLGPELHYHHGVYLDADRGGSDEAYRAAMQRAVRELYDFIPLGSRVLDVGCGWGGPQAMLVGERGCATTGITSSIVQARHGRERGLHVRHADVEHDLEPGRFDVALLLESFEHIRDKDALLAQLRCRADTLVMRVNCQDAAPASSRFGATMHMIDSSSLRARLERAGWRIVHRRDRRPDTLPSQRDWSRRLAQLQAQSFADDRHLTVFRSWVRHVLVDQARWARANPLLEIVAR